MGEHHEADSEQDKDEEMKQTIPRHRLGNHALNCGSGVSSQEHLSQHIRRVERLTSAQIDDEVPKGRHDAANQAGYDSLAQGGMVLVIHVCS
jgi:hypothetical protein